MMEDIRTAFRSIFFNGVANNLASTRTSPRPVIITQPAPIEIPSHLQTDLWIAEMQVGKRKPSDIVKKFPVRSKFKLSAVSASRRIVLFWHAHWPTFLDCEGMALLDSAQEIFANHPLDPLPVVRADSIAGLQINFGSNRRS